MDKIYNKYSDYLKNRYGERVYKIPINLPVTCPNRDGTKGVGGCTFCGEDGAGHENLEATMSIKEQLLTNIEYIGKRYKAKKFIPYFQNYTNTYLPVDEFEKYMEEVIIDNVVEIAVSTRPDCVSNEHLQVLQKIKEKYNVNITVELGLQTANYKSLKKINRGHSLSEYIETILNIKKYGFQVCTHIILNLPWDDIDDVIETAKIVSVLKSDYIKLHSLYIIKGTVMEEEYNRGDFKISSMEEYKKRVITFLEYLSPNVQIQRLIGRAPKDITSFANWGASWWKIRDEIEEFMYTNDIKQGDKSDFCH